MTLSNASARLVAAAAVSGLRVVTSAVPAAAAAGIAAYALGGNAFDAALSACFLETIALPIFPELREDEQRAVVSAIAEFLS